MSFCSNFIKYGVVDNVDQRSPNKHINMLCLKMEFVTSEDMKGPNLGFNERTARFSTLLKYFFSFLSLEIHTINKRMRVYFP